MFRSFIQDRQRIGLTLAFGSLVCAGTYSALAKSLTPFLSPMSLLILSEGLTAAFIVMTFGLVPLLREFLRMDVRSVALAIVIGFLNSVIAPLLWFSGLAHTSAVNASMLSATEIIFIVIFAGFFLGETLKRAQIIGAMIALIGVLIINVFPDGGAVSIHAGDLLIILGAIVYASGAVLFKRYLSHVMPELTIAIRNVVGVVTVLCVSIMLRHSFVAEVKAFPIDKVLLLIAFAFFSRYLNLTFFYEAIERLSATTLSLIEIGNPLSGIIFASLLLGEGIAPVQVVGGLFILCGLLVEQISLPIVFHYRPFKCFFCFRKRFPSMPLIHSVPRHI